ncbi:MAG TPA: toxin TcdB middle/N-terminal domain-containing protein [Polyangiaceae bacterium]|nr:toxin TcdB middle/N-terminal domain-containing protein [Polyangiaceae bacterium]
MLRRFRAVVAALTAAAGATSIAPPAAAGGTDPTRISLPKGPGSIEGLGRTFTPSLASGTAGYGLDLALPPAANGFGPALSFDYDSGGGVSELGLGWRLGGVPKVQRRTENGLPRFDASDAFELAGIGVPCDLLEITPGVYRPEYETGAFVRVTRSGPSWEARDKAGTTYRFGGSAAYEEAESGHAAALLLKEKVDLYGHSVHYEWDVSDGHALLTRVVWNDVDPSARNEAVFHYEARPDPVVRFSVGIRQTLRRRLAAVEVRHGGALVRRYALGYAPAGRSRLERIVMTGRDGVTEAPPLSFAYTGLRLEAAASAVTMAAPPGRSPGEPGNDLVDLDGDGLPDLLVTEPGQYRSYVNRDGRSWEPARAWAPTESPSVGLASAGVQLADVDGDGAVDLLAKSGTDSFRYFPGKDATHFAPPVVLPRALNVSFEDPDVRLADIDGDRRADVVVSTAAGLAIGYNLGGRDWAEPVLVGQVDPNQPLRFSDGQTSLCDVNGDRVQDLCYLRPGALTYWLGRGRGEFEPAQGASNVPAFDPSSPWQLHDLDGDGWVDLVHVGVNVVEAALARGEGAFDDPVVIGGVPERLPTTAVRFVDMNGSGTTDIVWVDVSGGASGAWRYLELFPEGRGGLLARIDNGLGKVTRIEYAPAALDAAAAKAAGTPWATRMNVAMPVVKRVLVDDSLGDPSLEVRYDYRDGTWDAPERTFAGFGGGTETEVGDAWTPTLVTANTFDAGLTHRALRGSPLTSERRDASGTVFSRSSLTYRPVPVANAPPGRPVDYPCRAAERVETLEGRPASEARVTLTEWQCDAYGNVTAELRWGEVAGDDKLAGHDEALTYRTYAQDIDEWVLGRPATEELVDAAGKRHSLKRTYYDGEPFVGLPLGRVVRGNASRRDVWVGPGEGDFELEVATAYNADGQPVETRDARGGGRLFEWSPVDRTTLVSEAVKLAGYTLVERAVTDPAFGNLLSVTGYAGEITSFTYDALGRLTGIARPGDTDASPTVRYSYVQGSPLSRVITEARIHQGRDELERTEELYDGLGRKRGALTREGEGRWVLAGVSLLDARGNARRSLRSRFVGPAEHGAPPLLDEAPGSTIRRDALGRAVSTRSTMGLEDRTAYAPRATLTWDGAQNDPASPYEHTPVVKKTDGLGRAVETARTLGGVVFSQRAAYDAAGRLVTKIDPEGHASRYEYDGAGRRTLAADPDQGEHRFVYAAGDLVEHRRPDGSVRRWTYDLAGRERTQDWDGDGAPEVEKTWGDEPDAPATEWGAARLVRVRDPSGSVETEHDERGRVARSTRAIEGRTYVVESGYDDQDREDWHRFPDGSSITIHRNLRGQLAGYGEGALRIEYDGDGAEVERRYATGVVEQSHYDEDRRRDGYRVLAADGSPLIALRWDYDGAGNLTGARDERPGVDAIHDRSEVYLYDNFYRLTQARGAWGATRWAYSPSGNAVERTSTDPAQHAGPMTFGEGAGPHALTGLGGRHIAYDALGRMTGDGERTYRWTAVDRLAVVSLASGPSVESTYDAEGERRIRVERAGDGAQKRTHFVDAWSEVRDGKLVRYLVHGGRRVVRLSDTNGASAGAGPGPDDEPDVDYPVWLVALARQASTFALGMTLLWVLAFTQRRRLARWAPAAALVVLATGCCCDGGSEGAPPQGGSIETLSDDDTLLFTDRIGSLLEAASGKGSPLGSFAAHPFGPTRWDTAPEDKVYASGTRDRATGIDVIGKRALALELGVWASPDPEALRWPEQSLNGGFAAGNPYAYANDNPLRFVDPSGGCAVPADLKAGQVGICIDTFIASKRLGDSLWKNGLSYLGFGDNRTFAPNDSQSTFRSRTSLVVDFAKSERRIHNETVSGVSKVDFAPDLTGKAEASVGDETLDKQGNLTFSVSGKAINGHRLWHVPFSPSESIDFKFNLKVSRDGRVSVLPGSLHDGYPSYEIYSYTKGKDGDVNVGKVYQFRETTIDKLAEPMDVSPAEQR